MSNSKLKQGYNVQIAVEK